MNDIITFFGLKQLPFNKTIKSKDALETEALRECSARLDYMKRHRGIMLLTGDPGAGKTIALRRFVDSLNENVYRPVYTPLTTLSSFDLLRHISNKLGLKTRNAKSVLFRQIQQEFFDSKTHNGKTIVLIIDEAQLLKLNPLQELRLLTNFKMDSYDPFIIILSGQSELTRIMDYAIMEPLAQRIAMRYHMPPLNQEETKNYVNVQLKLAGCSEQIFNDSALHALYELSYGIPRKIGSMALEAMTYAMFSNTRNIDANMIVNVKSGG